MKFAPIVLGAALASLATSAALAGQQDPDAASLRHDLSGVPVNDRGDVITWRLVTNGPVPDTPANRVKYEPLSHAGRLTAPAGD
jgi:hypothetical protein